MMLSAWAGAFMRCGLIDVVALHCIGVILNSGGKIWLPLPES